ncbi:MAG: MFS transporter [Gammaproteobacteria bacterium]|jgi:MFS family permease|nr:MFS transporter [Gammaproteobacteria bacterium]|tara:strand:- start:5746 stop:7092 length:1347 start_codon:yes stop_codon:yes gene_type:complete
MNKQEVHTAASIGLLYLIRMLGLFMVLPVLPIAGRDLGYATPALIGLALGAYGLSQAVLQIPLGLMSDKYGRKNVIFAGLSLFIAGSLVAAFSESIYGVIVGRFLQGCGAISSSLLALMSDLTRIDHRSKAMAIIGMSIGVSFALALVLGPLVSSYFGLKGVFVFAALAGVCGVLVLLTVIPVPKVKTQNLESVLLRDRLPSVLSDPGLLRMDVGIFMVHYLLMSSFIVFPLILEATGVIPSEKHHLYYLGMLLASFVLMGPFMWLSDKSRYANTMLLLAIAAFVSSLVFLAGSETYYFVLASMTLFFMAFNLLEVLLPARVSKMAAAGSRGTAMGVYSSSQFAGIFAGGTVGGLILSHTDISTLLYTNATLSLLWLTLSVRLPELGDITSRTYSYDEGSVLSANQILERLSSIRGVVDVVIIEEERIAYLKVDNGAFDDGELALIGN